MVWSTEAREEWSVDLRLPIDLMLKSMHKRTSALDNHLQNPIEFGELVVFPSSTYLICNRRFTGRRIYDWNSRACTCHGLARWTFEVKGTGKERARGHERE